MVDRMWNCPDCNETIENSLDVCWNCGTSREGDRDPNFKSADEITWSETTKLPPLNVRQLAAKPSTMSIKLNRGLLLAAFVLSVGFVSVLAWFALPKTASDFYDLGLLHLHRKEYPQAVKALTRSLERLDQEEKPFNPRKIHTARAVAYTNLEDYENALRDISQAIDLIPAAMDDVPLIFLNEQPGNVMLLPDGAFDPFFLIRANALMGLGRNEQAMSDLKLILTRNPKNPDAQRLLAVAQQQERDGQ